MNEYLCRVILDDKEDEIKTYAFSKFEAFDNLICMLNVKEIISVTDLNTKETFIFTGDLNVLRKSRSSIKDESFINEILNAF